MTTAQRWIVTATVLGSGIVFLDSTVVNVALPRIKSFFATLEAQSYVYNGYLLSLSTLLILAGALSDRYGRRRMYGWGGPRRTGFGAGNATPHCVRGNNATPHCVRGNNASRAFSMGRS
ncbi:MAG: MFS transporter [Deinococcota bacterium]